MLESEKPLAHPNFNKMIATHAQWLAGVIDAAGSFYITFGRNKATRTGFSVGLTFDITTPSEIVAKKIYNIFRRGRIIKGETVWHYRIQGTNLPSVLLHSALMAVHAYSVRTREVDLWLEALEVTRALIHLEPHGLLQLSSIRRKLTGKKVTDYKIDPAKMIESDRALLSYREPVPVLRVEKEDSP